MKALWFYVKFFLKGGYINSFSKLKFSAGTWIGKSVNIFFEKPGDEKQTIFLGKGVRIGHFSDLSVGPTNRLIIKDFTTTNTHCKITGDVTIERYCLLSANILISSGTHYATKFPHRLIRHQDNLVLSDPDGAREHSKPVHIEEDVWIGFGVFIKQGLTIGRGAVLGANSVVLTNVGPYEIVAGNPARKLKQRFDFKPGSLVDISVADHLPYFYRGFDHYSVNTNNPGRKPGIPSFEESCVAISAAIREVSVEGYLLATDKLELHISIAGVELGTYLITEQQFALRLVVPDSALKKMSADTYTFITFAVRKSGVWFGLYRIKNI